MLIRKKCRNDDNNNHDNANDKNNNDNNNNDSYYKRAERLKRPTVLLNKTDLCVKKGP